MSLVLLNEVIALFEKKFAFSSAPSYMTIRDAQYIYKRLRRVRTYLQDRDHTTFGFIRQDVRNAYLKMQLTERLEKMPRSKYLPDLVRKSYSDMTDLPKSILGNYKLIVLSDANCDAILEGIASAYDVGVAFGWDDLEVEIADYVNEITGKKKKEIVKHIIFKENRIETPKKKKG